MGIFRLIIRKTFRTILLSRSLKSILSGMRNFGVDGETGVIIFLSSFSELFFPIDLMRCRKRKKRRTRST